MKLAELIEREVDKLVAKQEKGEDLSPTDWERIALVAKVNRINVIPMAPESVRRDVDPARLLADLSQARRREYNFPKRGPRGPREEVALSAEEKEAVETDPK